MPDDELGYYPGWGMLGLCASFLALLVAIITASKQSEMADRCVLRPKK